METPREVTNRPSFLKLYHHCQTLLFAQCMKLDRILLRVLADDVTLTELCLDAHEVFELHDCQSLGKGICLSYWLILLFLLLTIKTAIIAHTLA